MKVTKRIYAMLLALALMIAAIPMNAFAKGDIMYGVAVVDASSLRLRAEANTTSKTLATAPRGEVVTVVSKQGDWYKVNYNLQIGYMHSDYLKVKTAENVELGYGKIDGTSVNLRSGAGTSYKSVATGSNGDKAYILGIKDGWYKVIYGSSICYVRSDYLSLTEIPYENKASKNAPLFYRGGKSTGTEPSADALGGSTGNTSPTPTPDPEKPNTIKPDSDAPVSAVPGVKLGIAFVTGSGLRLRSEANTASKTVASASKGEVVVVISKHGDWYKVIYNLKEGYMHGDYLSVRTTENAELGYGKVTASAVNLRSGAGTGNKSLGTASKGTKAYILGIKDGWYRVICGNQIAYIRSDYLDLTEAPYENNASSKSPLFYRGGKSTGKEPSADALGGTSSPSAPSTGNSVAGQQIVDKAKQYLGVPYVWGGASPSGFDCSGFVYYVLRSLGIPASRTLNTMYTQGTPVSKSELQPGDIVFFQNTYKSGISHVGIYVGNGKFIHSPHSGEVVSYADLYSDYYISHYYGACRIRK